MITRQNVKTIAEKYIDSALQTIVELSDKAQVWFFIRYTTKEEIETSEATKGGYGNKPFIIDKKDGEIHDLPSPIILHFNKDFWNPAKHGKRCSPQHKQLFIEEYIEKFLREKYSE